MKLDYFTLLSKSPLKLNICSIKSPLLREIDEITIQTYNNYLNILLLNINMYYKTITENDNHYLSFYSPEEKDLILKIKDEYDKMADEEKANIQILSILAFDFNIMDTIEKALNFFIVELVKYSPKEKSFFVFDGKVDDKGNSVPNGQINETNYSTVVDLILQRNGRNKKEDQEDLPKFKDEKTKLLWLKIQKAKNNKKKEVDENMELANIISSLAAFGQGLNIINIWDMTVYQLYDQFHRERANHYFNISSMSVACWGDKDNHYNGEKWYENINKT